MLGPRNQFCSSLRRISRRCRQYSNVAPSYHPKVRVYPFRVSPEDAIRDMSVAAGVPFFGQFISSILSRWFPGSGFKPFQPASLQPFYLPAWVIDAEFTGNAWVTTGEETQQHQFTAVAVDSYMPGFVHEPISRLCLNDTDIYDLESVTWSPKLETQYGVKPVCLPFTISPLGLPDVVRHFSYRDATVHENFRFDPTSLKTNLLAAYPILIPVYLARYEYDIIDEKVSITVIQDASRKTGRIISENTLRVSNKMLEKSNISFRWGEDPEFLVWRANPVPFCNIFSIYAPDKQKTLTSDVNLWVNEMADKPDSFTKLARYEEMQKVDMDDLRVREFTKEERESNQKWMISGLGALSTQAMLNLFSQTVNHLDNNAVHVFRMGKNQQDLAEDKGSNDDLKSANSGPFGIERTSLDEFGKVLEGKLEKLKAQRQEAKPQWLKELHAREGHT